MGLKEYAASLKKSYAEKQAYNKFVAKRSQESARQAYAKEAVKQSALAAQRRAQAQYNKPKSAGVMGIISGFGRATTSFVAKKTRPVRVSKSTKKVKRQVVRSIAPMQSRPMYTEKDMFGFK